MQISVDGAMLGAMAQWLRRWIPNSGVLCSNPLGGFKVDKMSARNFWELSGKK